jgi:hypothetical protein
MKKQKLHSIREGLTLILAQFAFASCVATNHPSEEHIGKAENAISLGYDEPDAPNSGVVYIRAAGSVTSGLQFIENGTGTFVDDDWILTAAHVVHDAASPMDVEIRRGNRLDFNAEVRRGRRIVIHPRYEANTAYDVALVQLDQPYNVTPTPRFLTALSRDDIVSNLPLVECYGYGFGGAICPPTRPPGTLSSSSFTPTTNLEESGWFNVIPPFGAVLWKGDSGGPCIDPNDPDAKILGVISRSSVSCDSPEGNIVAADSFRDWASLVTNPLTLYTVNGDFDLDGKGDIGALQYLPGGPVCHLDSFCHWNQPRYLFATAPSA